MIFESEKSLFFPGKGQEWLKENQCSGKTFSQNHLAAEFALAGIPAQA